jgi:uncharacterized membrane protein YraQ (UPF0718 family)
VENPFFQVGCLMISPVTGQISVLFLSLFFEAVPFLLLGAILSSLLHVFVPERIIGKLIPKNRVAAILLAPLLALVFPVCECAVVPVTRGLLKKGVPFPVAGVLLVSLPILNPLTILSTWLAFRGYPLMTLYRAGGGLLLAWLTGFWLQSVYGRAVSEDLLADGQGEPDCCAHEKGENPHRFPARLGDFLRHASGEFLSALPYFLAGITLASVFKGFVSVRTGLVLSDRPVLSLFGMTGLSWGLSLCSEADAFVARSFLGAVPAAAIFAFLLTGPVIDLKNTLMLFGLLKKPVAARLVFMLVSLCLVFGLTATLFEVFRRFPL